MPAGPATSANVSTSPASGSLAVNVRANAVPTAIVRLACGASCGAWFVCTTVTLKVVVAELPLLSVTRAVNVCVPSCAAVGTQSISGAGFRLAPAGAVVSA